MSLFWEYFGHIMLLVYFSNGRNGKRMCIKHIHYEMHVYLFTYTYAFRCLNQAYLKWKDERHFIDLTSINFILTIFKVLFQVPSREITILKKPLYNGTDMHRIFGKTNENLFSQRNKRSFLWPFNWDLKFK